MIQSLRSISSPPRRSIPRDVLLLFLAGSLLLYLPAFNNGFRRDDFAFLEQMVQFGKSWKLFAPVDRFAFFRPGAIAMFRVEYAVFGMHSAPYLVVNYVLHAACALVGLRVLRKIGSGETEATVAAGLFLLGLGHYGKTVIWVASGGTVVSNLLCIVAVGLARDAGRSVGARVGLLGAAVCAPAFHEVGILAGPLALVYALADTRASRKWTAVAAIVGCAVWIAVWTAVSRFYLPYSAVTEGIWLVPKRFAGYLSLLVVPFGNAAKASPQIRKLLALVDPVRIPAGVVLGAVLVFVAVRSRRNRFLVLWTFAALVPFTAIASVGDALQLRYTYVASLPFCALAVRLIVRAPAKWARTIVVALVLYGASVQMVIERHYDRSAHNLFNRTLRHELQELGDRVHSDPAREPG